MKELTQDIEQTVKTLLTKVGKEKDVSNIRSNSKLADDLGIDSFGSIEVIYGLEDIFDITISERNFNPSMTVEGLINQLQAKLRTTTQKQHDAVSVEQFKQSLQIDKSIVEDVQFNPYYRNISSGLGRTITIDNKELLSLGSNDYLGIANNAAIKQEAARILEKYGLSMCGTPIVIGQTDINRQLEKTIARFLKQDDAIVYPSGYQCNMGVFQLLAREDDCIIADKNVHSSLINGCMLSKASLRFFNHNNMAELRTMLQEAKNSRMRFIVVEGLYSTDGDTAKLDTIIKLAQEFEAFLIVDDAHGVGVLGKEGRGILEKYNAYNDVDLITGSLGKALGVFGGFLAGEANIIDYYRYSSSSYFYSTALPPYVAAAGIASIEFVKTHNDLREKTFAYKEKLYSALQQMGYRLTQSETPLFAILFSDSKATLAMTKQLFEKGIYAVPFLPPSVPKDSPRIRLLPSAYLAEQDIDRVIEVFRELKSAYVG
ncbi:aminotransferase class I/II-fold pyridoxal phosphate-dependent enzyme [Candidatus Omnitrophota bacterium]